MSDATTITLIAHSRPHGVMEAATETERTIYAHKTSVGMRETYAASSAGLSPEVVFEIAVKEDYTAEKKLRWNGDLYRVIRTDERGSGIKLICGRWDNDV